MKDPKFGLGAIVKHRAATKHNARKLLITGRALMECPEGSYFLYQLSFEKENYVARDDSFGRVMLSEDEIELYS